MSITPIAEVFSEQSRTVFADFIAAEGEKRVPEMETYLRMDDAYTLALFIVNNDDDFPVDVVAEAVAFIQKELES